MQVTHQPSGMIFDFPDGTDPTAIQQHFRNSESQAGFGSQIAPIAQQFLNGAQDLYAQQQTRPAPVNGRGMIGLNPQQAQYMLDRNQQQQALYQQQNIERQRQAIQERQLTTQSIEAEKDRSQKIKLFHQQLKNQQAIAKARAEADKFEAEMKAQGKADDNEFRVKLEQMRHDARMLEQQNKSYTLSPGAMLTDAQGNVIRTNPKAPSGSAQIDPNKILGTEVIGMNNPDTGDVEDVVVNRFADGSFSVLGPAPKKAERKISPYEEAQIRISASKQVREDPNNTNVPEPILKKQIDSIVDYALGREPKGMSPEEKTALVKQKESEGYTAGISPETGEVIWFKDGEPPQGAR